MKTDTKFKILYQAAYDFLKQEIGKEALEDKLNHYREYKAKSMQDVFWHMVHSLTNKVGMRATIGDIDSIGPFLFSFDPYKTSTHYNDDWEKNIIEEWNGSHTGLDTGLGKGHDTDPAQLGQGRADAERSKERNSVDSVAHCHWLRRGKEGHPLIEMCHELGDVAVERRPVDGGECVHEPGDEVEPALERRQELADVLDQWQELRPGWKMRTGVGGQPLEWDAHSCSTCVATQEFCEAVINRERIILEAGHAAGDKVGDPKQVVLKLDIEAVLL